MHTLYGWWLGIWPNLAASAITWAAVTLSHRWHLNKRLTELHARLDELHAKLDDPTAHVEVNGAKLVNAIRREQIRQAARGSG